MLNYQITVLHPKNGIQRDGTPYFSEHYVAGQWVRFYENVPKKMGGCTLTLYGDSTIIRTLYTIPQATSFYLYMGRNPVVGGSPVVPGNIQYSIITNDGVAGVPVDRTPTDPAFVPRLNTIWVFDTASFRYAPAPYSGASTNLLFANYISLDMESQEAGPIFVGGVNNPDMTPATSPLVPVYDKNMQLVEASGGILYCAPVIVAYGNNGNITWTGIGNDVTPFDPGSPTSPGTWDTTTDVLNLTNTKIVKAANTRGSGSPTMLLWSLNSLCRATLTQTNSGLQFVNTIVQDNISIIAPNSVVNYEQQFFWIGTDQFYVYNGIVQNLPNSMNNDWFFNNVNLAQTNKIWGVAVPRYKEIWWFYVRGSTATECNATIIYNIEQNIWYDNTIDPDDVFNIHNFTRSAGVQASGQYPFPIYADNTLINNPITPTNDTYPIWTHESGINRTIGDKKFAIPSTYTTPLIDLWSSQGSTSNLINNRRIVPDFLQTGVMSVELLTKTYPNDPTTAYGPFPFDKTTPFIDFNCQGALNSFTFASNVVDGDYQAGKILYFYQKGDTLK